MNSKNEQAQPNIPPLGCPDHPQSLIYWRKIEGVSEKHPCCFVCAAPLDPEIRSKLISAESAEIKSFFVFREHARRVDSNDPIENYTLGLAEEVGEVLGIIRKYLYRGVPLDREKLIEELGDVLWNFDRLAAKMGISLEEIADFNTRKLAAIYPNGFSADRSRSRDRTKKIELYEGILDSLLREKKPTESIAITTSFPSAEPIPTPEPSIKPSGPMPSPGTSISPRDVLIPPTTQWPTNWLEYCGNLIRGLERSFEFFIIDAASDVFNDIAKRLNIETPLSGEIHLLGKKICVNPDFSPGTIIPRR